MAHPLYVLMWKDLTVRKRRYIMTILELAWPLLMNVLLFSVIHSGDENASNFQYSMFMSFVVVFTWFHLIFMHISTISRLHEERTSGIQELIKVSGASQGTVIFSHVLNAAPAGLLYALVSTILFTCFDLNIPKANSLILFTYYILFYAVNLSIAFFVSYLINNTQYVITLALFTYALSWIAVFSFLEQVANILLNGTNETPDHGSNLISYVSWIPNFSCYMFWGIIALMRNEEFLGIVEGATFGTIMKNYDPLGSIFMVFLRMLVQIVVFSLFTCYLSLVFPGQYGRPLPWNFIFQKQYWMTQETMFLIGDEEETIDRDPRHFEKLPVNMKVGIKIFNVSKMYSNKKVLSNVSVDVLEGEITVLLGHNGAGKTTLMSIITGMLAPSSGSIYVNGLDTRHHMDKVRKTLGLCPQHNLFFKHLTLLEHVVFFSVMRGTPFASAWTSSRKLLRDLGLADKMHSLAAELSGGMKRRLQLAMALAGDAKVLVLDEPTSGLDTETRHSLWTLVLKMRGQRTLLLSTHFMEEADALGDRVIALHSGNLRCHATTMHLKHAVGTGYRLTFTTLGTPNHQEISEIVATHVPEAKVQDQGASALTFSLPANSNYQFPKMFEELESKKEELFIDTMGVGATTIEEVFLKLCCDIDHALSLEDEVIKPEPEYRKAIGSQLLMRQFLVLWMRQIKFHILSKKISFFLFRLLVPVLAISYMTKNSIGTKFVKKRNEYIVTSDTDDEIIEIPFLAPFWSHAITFVTLIVNMGGMSLACRERLSGARRMLEASGAAPIILWVTTLLFNIVLALVTVILPTILSAIFLSGHIINTSYAVAAIGVSLTVGSLALISFAFLFSFSGGEKASSALMVLIIIICGLFVPLLDMILTQLPENPDESPTLKLFRLILPQITYVAPPRAFGISFELTALVATYNFYCNQYGQYCDEAKSHCYFCFGEKDPGKYWLLLLVQFAVCVIWVVAIDMGVFVGLWDKLCNVGYKPPPKSYNGSAVNTENAYVANTIALPKKMIQDTMLAHDIHKNYARIFGKSCNALRGISFSIKKGECFGLLGVNGAGKSTAFKILTGEIAATRGQAFANGHYETRANLKYVNSMGYCPQFFGLDDFLTGAENLRLVLTLRGFTDNGVTELIKYWIDVVGLDKYANREVSKYSGGCKRRIATACALSVGAKLTLLDEPTAGVDAGARRRVWRALRCGQAGSRSVLLSSHSMDETEALCARVAIMSRGELCALGEPAALRVKYADHLTLRLKLKTDAIDGTDNYNARIGMLKSELHKNFNCVLKDQHKTMLQYKLRGDSRYSVVFAKLEGLKSTFPDLLEDYSVAATTLEEVFLAFAEKSREEP